MKKYYPKRADGGYHHKSRSGKAFWPWDKLSYHVKTERELDRDDIVGRNKHEQRKRNMSLDTYKNKK